MFLMSLSPKLIVRLIIFWINKIIKPRPNSIAEKTKKKNVKAITLTLSYKIPIYKVIEYNVIHKISAVNKRCKEVLVFNKILKKKKKKKKKKNLKF